MDLHIADFIGYLLLMIIVNIILLDVFNTEEEKSDIKLIKKTVISVNVIITIVYIIFFVVIDYNISELFNGINYYKNININFKL